MNRYIFEVLSWRQIRAEYLRLVQAAKEQHITRDQIASHGGLDKHYISKMLGLSPKGDGPQVANFMKALKGIGVSKPSEFFDAVEKRAAGESPPDLVLAAVPGKEEQHQRELGQRLQQLVRDAGASPAPPRPRGRSRKPRSE